MVNALEDRETVAKQMVHYGLMIVPVVDDSNHFLGVIPSDILIGVIVQEATEDVHKMAALAPMKQPYLKTALWVIAGQRGSILVALLIAESISGFILDAHETILACSLTAFIPMLISAGGNASNQTSAMVLQGMASGEIGWSDSLRFLRREAIMAFILATILGAAAFLRVYLPGAQCRESLVIAISVWLTVLLSVTLGSGVPFLLKRLNIDPAFSAGPFLATIMDIIGVSIFCYVTKILLF